MSGILKNSMTLIGLIIIAVLGYYLFVMQKDSNTSLDSKSQINDARAASEQFLSELDEIKNIELSTDIFTDRRFQSFTDFTKPVPSQPLGRQNPFAPLE